MAEKQRASVLPLSQRPISPFENIACLASIDSFIVYDDDECVSYAVSLVVRAWLWILQRPLPHFRGVKDKGWRRVIGYQRRQTPQRTQLPSSPDPREYGYRETWAVKTGAKLLLGILGRLGSQSVTHSLAQVALSPDLASYRTNIQERTISDSKYPGLISNKIVAILLRNFYRKAILPRDTIVVRRSTTGLPSASSFLIHWR
ncbi:hypothetical protein F4679DRAFT_580787 [Xylaria curta]|nr:hypothetical protein F4679DRAFT_580787 [Xylaria curta]